jgi:hypothetical protein
MIHLILTLLTSVFGFTLLAQKTVESDINTSQLRPALLYWDFGMIETIYQTQDSSGTFWNVIHRSPEPEKTLDGYDYYKMHGKTLRPLISEMFYPGATDYSIRFTGNEAAIHYDDKKDSVDYTLNIPHYVSPEGPGTPVFWASLPLTPGYTISYHQLDRWAGKGKQKGVLVTKQLKVSSGDKLTLGEKQYDTYKIDVTSDQGSSVTAWVLKNPPHYWLKVLYRPNKDKVFESKVTRIFIFE